MEDADIKITLQTAIDYTSAVFINLINLLEAKKILTSHEMGEALLRVVKQPSQISNPSTDAYVAALGQVLTGRDVADRE